MTRFSTTYFVLTCWLFFIELLIGRYLDDDFIRPYGGDFLVVILIYCFVKTWVDTPVLETALGVLIFSYLIELSQYFHLVNLLGWQGSYAARLLMGTSFSLIDLLIYSLGALFIIIAEKILNHEQPATA